MDWSFYGIYTHNDFYTFSILLNQRKHAALEQTFFAHSGKVRLPVVSPCSTTEVQCHSVTSSSTMVPSAVPTVSDSSITTSSPAPNVLSPASRSSTPPSVRCWDLFR